MLSRAKRRPVITIDVVLRRKFAVILDRIAESSISGGPPDFPRIFWGWHSYLIVVTDNPGWVQDFPVDCITDVRHAPTVRSSDTEGILPEEVKANG